MSDRMPLWLSLGCSAMALGLLALTPNLWTITCTGITFAFTGVTVAAYAPRGGEVPTPEDVAVVMPDGTRTPCELFYTGQDADGLHVWEATTSIAFRPGMHITAATLPARTAIVLRED